MMPTIKPELSKGRQKHGRHVKHCRKEKLTYRGIHHHSEAQTNSL